MLAFDGENWYNKIKFHNEGMRRMENKGTTAGKVVFSEDVIIALMKKAIAETDGITTVNSGLFNKKPAIRAVIEEAGVSVSASVSVEYGRHIPDAILALQQKAAGMITDMTGLTVLDLNIVVADVAIPKEEEAAE